MSAAYLRGLLLPDIYKHGARSTLRLNYILECVGADINSASTGVTILADSAIMSSLTDESKKETLSQVQANHTRYTELLDYDLYAFDRRASLEAQLETNTNLSAVSLFKLLKKANIIKDAPDTECPISKT